MSDTELKGELVIPEKLYVPLRSFGNRLIIADDERFREDDIVYTRTNAKEALIKVCNKLIKLKSTQVSEGKFSWSHSETYIQAIKDVIQNIKTI